jgi:hypothetical protein
MISVRKQRTLLYPQYRLYLLYLVSIDKIEHARLMEHQFMVDGRSHLYPGKLCCNFAANSFEVAVHEPTKR